MKITTKLLKNAIKQLSNLKQERFIYDTSLIYCQLENNVLSLTRFNLECNLTVKIDASGENCKFSIPETVIKFISNIKSPEIEVSFNESKADLNGFIFDCSHSTEIKTNETNYIGEINNGIEFNECIIKTVPYMESVKGYREAHKAICFRVKDKILSVYATNGIILRKQEMQTDLNNCEFRLPLVGSTILSKLISQSYKFYLGKDCIKIDGVNFIFNSRLNDPYEIDYECVMPTESTTKVKFNADKLRQTIPQLKATNKFKFQMSINGMIRLNSNDDDLGLEFNSEFNHIEKTGDDLQLCFDCDLMSRVLEDDSEIQFNLTTPQRAVLIKSNNITRLLMPICI